MQYFSFQKNLQSSAFTIAELIVVITILSILATIGFISYQGYTEGVRDSARMADISNVQSALEAYVSKGNQAPTPTNAITLIASGSSNTIGYQWKIGPSILSSLGMGDAKDSKTGDYYTYITNTSGDTQVIALLEASPTNSVFSKGASLGILFSTGTIAGASSTIIPLDSVVVNTGSIDVALTNTGYTAIFGSDVSNRATGTGVNLITAYSTLSLNGKDFAQYDSSLVGYWDMETLTSDGKLKDLSGYGNNGAIIGNLSIWNNDGLFGKSTRFWNTTDYVRIENSPSLSISGDFTILTTVNIQDFNGAYANPIIVKWDTLTTRSYYIQIGSAKTTRWLVITNSWNSYWNIATQESITDQWQKIAFVKVGQKITLYINNIEIQSQTIDSPTLINNSNPLYFGHNWWSPTTDIFNWYIDNTRIYNRALLENEIQNIYKTEK